MSKFSLPSSSAPTDEDPELAQRKPKQFTNVFVLDQPPAGWKGPSGFIGEATLKSVLPPASLGENIKIFICTSSQRSAPHLT